jgi:spore germination protein GerM
MRRAISGAVSLVLIVGLLLAAAVPRDVAAAAPAQGTKTVTAFYVRDTGRALQLVREQRTLPTRTLGVARASVEQSLMKPKTAGAFTLAPTGTKVRSVNLKNRILIIDLNAKVRRNPGVGAAGEWAFIQQLAHAAGQYPTIDAIRLRVEGRPISQLWGHVDTSRPIRPDPSLLPRPKQTVTAFYVRDTGRALQLVREQRTLPTRTLGVARASVEQSLMKPKTAGAFTLAPTGTKVRSVNLKNRILIIDLNAKVRRNPGVGAAGEWAFIQQLAHAAGQYPTIDAIRLRVEGRPISQLWGHVDLSRPIRPDPKLLAR